MFGNHRRPTQSEKPYKAMDVHPLLSTPHKVLLHKFIKGKKKKITSLNAKNA